MTDVFDVLSVDHFKTMLIALESSTDAAGRGSEAVRSALKQVAEQLVISSSRHEAAEEQYFWPAVRAQLGNGNQLADQAIAQETEAKEVLDKIDKLDAGDAEFDRLITEFIPAARQHIEFEESQVWPDLRQALSRSRHRNSASRSARPRSAARPGRIPPPRPARRRSSRQARRSPRSTSCAMRSAGAGGRVGHDQPAGGRPASAVGAAAAASAGAGLPRHQIEGTAADSGVYGLGSCDPFGPPDTSRLPAPMSVK